MNYSNWWKKTSEELKETFSKNGIDNVSMETGQDYVRSLMTLFKHRG